MTNDSSIILKYFPSLSLTQQEQFVQLKELYQHWNSQINVISRKDIDFLYERHVLHSLGIAKIIQSRALGTEILDVGTGGGFPGIPLAILFPEVKFHLIDSIGKKIKVVQAVADALQLTNVTAEQIRAEDVNRKFDFILSRAVTDFPTFYSWVKNKIKKENRNNLANGILYLKGGELEKELSPFNKNHISIIDLKNFFEEEFFETKKVIYYH